jgi:PadR family transcriptional regulator PadR
VDSKLRITSAGTRVLQEFLADVSRPRYGYDLMEATGLASRKLYPILARLSYAGWLSRTPGEAIASQMTGPPRYTYKLSAEGAERARQELAVLSAQMPVSRLRRLCPQSVGASP